jgi:hypothetical protein
VQALAITVGEFAARHPQLYHMAEPGSWPSIEQYGLLSTSALLDLYGIQGSRRAMIESEHRPDKVTISHANMATAVARDQKPLNEKKLRSCLIDMEPSDWYRELNRRVFFWPSRTKLAKLLGARAYRDDEQLVITISTDELLARHVDRIRLSRINSGATVYVPVQRGRDTFVPLRDYPEEWWRDRRLGEVAVDYSVPDIRDFTVSVERWKSGAPFQTIFQR